MANMGFNTELKDSAVKREIDTIEELDKFINSEVRQYSEFESRLIMELKEVRHMEDNLKQLEIQMKAVELLLEKYNSLNEKLYLEIHKKNLIDIKKCDEYSSMLAKIKSELGPMNDKIIRECERLFINDTHKIYGTSEQEKNIMEEIDKKARSMVSKVMRIELQTKGIEEKFQQVMMFIQKIKQSRSYSAINEKKDPTGFA